MTRGRGVNVGTPPYCEGMSTEEFVVIDRDPFPVRDGLDLVVEAADMVTIFAAQRYERIDAFRRDAIDDARRWGHTPLGMVDRSVRLELAAALRITENAAGQLLATAEALVHRYPRVLDSLGRAGMTERHALVLIEELNEAPAHVRDRVHDRAVALAESLPLGTFRRRLRQLLDAEGADTVAERLEARLAERHVRVEPASDGMAWLTAYLPAVEAQAIVSRLTAIAHTLGGRGAGADANPDDDRTMDQRRADAFCDLLIEGQCEALPDEARGIRATVTVTVPVLTLLGDDRNGPPVVEGVGPIPLERARELAGTSDGWMRVLTHPETGVVLSMGRDRYRPPPELRRLVRWRAARCMAPGCGIDASRCELDHTVAWDHGGSTAADNLSPLCRGHHTLKHHSAWRVSQVPDSGGTMEWRSPSGRRYVVEPERRMPFFTTAPAV